MLSAFLGCAACSLLYVGVLYAHQGLPRDHPETIKKRMLAVSFACCLSWVPLAVLQQQAAQDTSLFELLGLRTAAVLPSIFNPLLLTATIFVGPILYSCLVFIQQGASIVDYVSELVQDLRSWRNLVVGPVTEEFVFRACMAPLFVLQGASNAFCIFVTPLFFGAAHLHHMVERVRHHGVSWRQAAFMALFQFTYTTLFGWYATYLFFRTHSLVAPTVAHMFSNYMGFPPFGSMAAHPCSKLLLTATVLGVLAFAMLLPSLTQPELFGL